LLPVGRFLLVAASTRPERVAACLTALGASRPGVCPHEFGWSPEETAAAFAAVRIVLYRGAPV
jgi:hypothetical protein